MYDSDLSDEEWSLIERHFRRQARCGHAILYLNKTGAQWRMLPKSVPPCQRVYVQVVHAAHVHDTKGACGVLEAAARKHATIQAFSGDAGYRGTAVEFVETTLGLKLHISQRIKDTSILPMRWVVERTFAWLGNYRRLSKDYEILKSTAASPCSVSWSPNACRF